ncbi:MAG: hypothetical protein J6D00_02280, partial [Christensenellaceae bacterium]|nr:hypothetical protein [Christensenellaceae bacterium]
RCFSRGLQLQINHIGLQLRIFKFTILIPEKKGVHAVKRAMKAIAITLCIVLVLGSIMTAVDLCRLHNVALENPPFVICTESMQDGGSGKYQGLFHSVDIKGNFMPEDELPGITHYTFYIFGIKVDEGIRD